MRGPIENLKENGWSIRWGLISDTANFESELDPTEGSLNMELSADFFVESRHHETYYIYPPEEGEEDAEENEMRKSLKIPSRKRTL